MCSVLKLILLRIFFFFAWNCGERWGRGIWSQTRRPCPSCVNSRVQGALPTRHCQSEESNTGDLLRINTERGIMTNDGQSRFSIKEKLIYNFLGTSTFGEYTVVHVGCVVKISPAAPLDEVCVLSCGISTGLQKLPFLKSMLEV